MNDFGESLKLFAEKTKLSVDIVLRKVTLDLARAVVLRSPVDTGRFRGNWLLGVGGIDTATLPDIRDDGDERYKGIRDTTMTPTLDKIEAALAGVHAGGVLYITNSLPYAIPLEYGHSKQAPRGMVRLTVREYKSYIDNAVRNLK